MRTNSILFIGFLVCVFLSTTSCLTYKDVEIKGIRGVKVANFSKTGIDAEIQVQVSNPNNYKITVVASDLDLSINKKAMGKASIANKIVLPKNSEEIHTLKIKATYRDSAEGGLLSLFSLITAKSIDLGVKGTIKAKAFLIHKKIDIDFTERVKL